MEYCYSNRNYLAMVLAALPFLRVIKFLPELPTSIYYGLVILIGITQYVKYGINDISRVTICFFIFCFISLLLNDVDPKYRAFERLIGLLCISLAVGPLIYNDYADVLRKDCLRCVCIFCILVCVASLGLYFIAPGLTYTLRGNLYGGITVHSMTLSPIGAIGTLYSIQYLIKNIDNLDFKIKLLWGGIVIICLINCIMAGSRSALISCVLAVITWLWFFFKDNKKFFFKYLISIITIISLSAPLWIKYTETIQKKIEYSESQGSMLSSRQGRWEARIDEIKHNPISGCGFSTIEGIASEKGTVEPGNGWLFIWSSAGLISFVLFCFIYYKAAVNAVNISSNNGFFIFSLLVFFAFHLMAEGYSISSGNPFCFMLWLTLGIGNFYKYSEL